MEKKKKTHLWKPGVRWSEIGLYNFDKIFVYGSCESPELTRNAKAHSGNSKQRKPCHSKYNRTACDEYLNTTLRRNSPAVQVMPASPNSRTYTILTNFDSMRDQAQDNRFYGYFFFFSFQSSLKKNYPKRHHTLRYAVKLHSAWLSLC